VGRSLSFVVLTLGALLGVAAPFLPSGAEATPGASGADATQLQALMGDLDGRVRETVAAVQSRATTLAEIPVTAAIVSTDATTTLDLDDRERSFRVQPGETIELGQLMTTGKTETIIELPADSPATPRLDQAGLRLVGVEGWLMISDVVFVKPSEPRPEIKTGVVAVTRAIDLAPFTAQLGRLGVPARLELEGKSVANAGGAFPEGGPLVTTRLASDVGQSLALVTPAGSGGSAASLPLRMIGGGGALVALVLGGLLLLLSGRKRPVVQPTGITRASVVGTAPTELGAGGLTPAPSADPQLMARPGSVTTQGVVGRYTLKRLLGSGGMAEVYLARVSGEAGFERDVALKVMHRALAAQPVVVEHFLDEARLASRLVHPNIVQISDLGRAGDEYFIAMEYIDGSDLENLLTVARQRGELVPVRVALAVARKIADGLHHAHTATTAEGSPLELVHRDVKSANVFISRKGEVKVGDFGIAKANQASRINKTQIGQVKGTAAYMAPEHRTGQAVDRRADLYGVGAITYELVTGAEVNLDLAILAHLGRQGWPHLPKPSDVRPELPTELDQILFKALAYEREDRYADCEAFEAELEAVATKYNLLATEKHVAQWVEAALRSVETRPSATVPVPSSGERA
jgi:Protein kinase domain